MPLKNCFIVQVSYKTNEKLKDKQNGLFQKTNTNEKIKIKRLLLNWIHRCMEVI